jgi:putative transposase
MHDLVVLFIHFIATLARLLGPGGARSIVAESLLLKHQLLIVNRSRHRSPNLYASDRILAGLIALWVRPARLLRCAIVLKPSTLLGLHKAMSKRKYRVLFSPNRRRKPGPKGPSAELIDAVVELKQRNPNWGCPRIAQQIGLAFHIQIDKDVVRRILANHYWPGKDPGGPSWLTFLGHMKDSLWSMDLFRCESAHCGPTGSWSSWISTRDGSLASASMRARSMVSHFVGCSTAAFAGTAGCQSTSAPTTILFISSTSGKLICGFWK